MSMIEDIKRDREAGTPGPWGIDGDYIVDLDELLDVCAVCRGNDGDARRIARVPDMEAALIAAEELVDTAGDAVQNADRLGDYEDPIVSLPLSVLKDMNNALAAFRAATGAA